MDLIAGIREKIRARRYEFSKHAVDQTIIRGIAVDEMEQALINRSIVIEDYAEDKYGPSCLILGYTDRGRPLHVHCSYPSRPLVKIVTVYEPDTSRWLDLRIRKRD